MHNRSNSPIISSAAPPPPAAIAMITVIESGSGGRVVGGGPLLGGDVEVGEDYVSVDVCVEGREMRITHSTQRLSLEPRRV